MILRTEQILEMPVLSLNEAKHLGKVTDVIIDTSKRKISGFMIQCAEDFQVNGAWFNMISSVGEDAVMLPSKSSLIDPSDLKLMDRLLAKHAPLKNNAIFTKDGKAYGTVIDYAFDSESGLMAYFVTQTPDNSSILIDISSARTFGQDLLIINDCVEYVSKIDNLELFSASEIDQNAGVSETEYVSETVAERLEQIEAKPVETELADIKDMDTAKPIQNIFERQHAKLLLGKKLIRDFKLIDGTHLATPGDKITEDMLEAVIKNRQLVELMVSVEKA